jgi:alpha-galactosidase
VFFRVPALELASSYDLRWEGPVEHRHVSMSADLPDVGPSGGRPVSGRVLGTRGFWVPRRRPETVTLVHVTRAV